MSVSSQHQEMANEKKQCFEMEALKRRALSRENPKTEQRTGRDHTLSQRGEAAELRCAWENLETLEVSQYMSFNMFSLGEIRTGGILKL